MVTYPQGADELKPAEFLNIVHEVAAAAQEIASPRLRSVLGNLETLSDSSFLPEELRTRAQVAAVRVAEAAMQLEELLRAIANEKGATGAPPPLDR